MATQLPILACTPSRTYPSSLHVSSLDSPRCYSYAVESFRRLVKSNVDGPLAHSLAASQTPLSTHTIFSTLSSAVQPLLYYTCARMHSLVANIAECDLAVQRPVFRHLFLEEAEAGHK